MKYPILIAFFFVIAAGCCLTGEKTAGSVEELHKIIASAQPGDQIWLANGVWEDAELLLNARGTEEKPILISAREKGKVVLTGNSCMRISGEYLEISGLLFSDGFTPTGEVISFREGTGVYANHCRVTECVVDGFNNPERFASETWVGMYGKNNRVDHCSFLNKRNHGVTFTVFPIDSACQENNHLIDHNYFGYRQTLGSNGGETMRLGTSEFSMSTCGTTVEANYFYRCNGELETISNKSCGNTFKDNTFWECEGTLTFRHGNDNLATGNFFFGNGKVNTGGIRIINQRNSAINNYLYGLTGYRLRGALVIMNGVPNSPINRYHQVVDGKFLNNTFVDCDFIQLCAGSDAERSLPPVNSLIEGNIFYHSESKELFTAYDDISGITIRNNFSNLPSAVIPEGIEVKEMTLTKNESGVFIPDFSGGGGSGCSYTAPVATSENTGAPWYPKDERSTDFGTGREINVEPGLNTLADAIKIAGPGDALILVDGEYLSTRDMVISFPLTIAAASADAKPVITSERTDMFTIANEGAMKLKGVSISGMRSPDNAGNSIITTSRYSMNCNYKLIVENCTVEDLKVNHSFRFFRIYGHTFADSIVLRNSVFKNISGSILELNKETDDLGIYNAEYVIIENSVFDRVEGSVLDSYRGGTDESTFGPNVIIDHCIFNESGNGRRNKSGAVVSLHGVQVATIANSIFNMSSALSVFLTVGDPVTHITNNNIFPYAAVKTNSKGLKTVNTSSCRCDFQGNTWFLVNDSPLKKSADDGKDKGINAKENT
ncbi:MAG: polysaccharide lyase 6 family protein [Bacteroidales bacterium]|nr:polysaccharide lyase 6 family protein [Bacteroidales bacterium]